MILSAWGMPSSYDYEVGFKFNVNVDHPIHDADLFLLGCVAALAFDAQLFVKRKDTPPISHNLPPVAGALTWSKGLLERVSLPMAKITGFNKKARCRLLGSRLARLFVRGRFCVPAAN